MDITTTAATTTTASTTKTPEADIETPARIQPNKPLSFTNGVLKRHHPYHHPHHHSQHHLTPTPVVVSYKECLKNHAASLGGHALDGCGEFMPSPTATPTDPTSLKCAACGCHRNFHRREPDDQQPQLPAPTTATTTHVMEYQPHHRHHPPPPPAPPRSPGSHSPPPISSSYYPSAPHMLLALSAGLSGPPPPPEINTPSSMGLHGTTMAATPNNPNGRKRFRTRFSQEQKEKMHQFAERVGWKMQKSNEELVAEFCNEIGVDRGVLKVWMHNNKNTLGKKDANGNGTTNLDENNNNDENQLHLHHHHQHNESSAHVATTNGSSSSS
ncbi:hypothetical protein L1049_003111 [Liquidambar formosana]|uniref:ZF-HD dimerization-type domain-containing protein n=1 Tax=Liquidambar formosana TaxID=63359 RepID=A0AAP0NLU7_LIQFO